jgi:hypothetical protein
VSDARVKVPTFEEIELRAYDIYLKRATEMVLRWKIRSLPRGNYWHHVSQTPSVHW